jgi:glycosyltransferase involved in cell wall biosynthesis
MSAFSYQKVELLIIGEGVDFKKYKRYVNENNIKNVKFLGPKYGEEKKLFLSACDCLILPSHTEGAPVVLMEAIAKRPMPALGRVESGWTSKR